MEFKFESRPDDDVVIISFCIMPYSKIKDHRMIKVTDAEVMLYSPPQEGKDGARDIEAYVENIKMPIVTYTGEDREQLRKRIIEFIDKVLDNFEEHSGPIGKVGKEVNKLEQKGW